MTSDYTPHLTFVDKEIKDKFILRVYVMLSIKRGMDHRKTLKFVFPLNLLKYKNSGK